MNTFWSVVQKAAHFTWLVIKEIWALLSRLYKWWHGNYQTSTGNAKAYWLIGGLMVPLLACCSLTTLLQSAGATPTPSALANVQDTEEPPKADVLVSNLAAEQLEELPTETAVSATAKPTKPPSPTPIPPTNTSTAVPSTNTPQPTATAVPATSTKIPPTSTSLPPTATAVLPTSTPLPTNTPAPPTVPPPPTEPPPQAAAQVIIIGVNKRDEYVDIQNIGGMEQDLSGWVLVSEKGPQSCTLGGILSPGAILRIWAMAEDAGNGGYNCGFGSNIWNNDEPDPAVLYDANGAVVSRK